MVNVLFEYAAKVVCGRGEGRVVAPGQYWTAVNVHNPNPWDITFRRKVAQALPREPGKVSRFYEARLGPDEALEIDCEEILELGGVNDFLKGFVVIQCSAELDVVAVYTAAGREESVVTLHTERVPPRRFRVGMPDLIPVPDKGGFYCRREDGHLLVTVRNQGDAPAGESQTEVDFYRHGSVKLPTPALGAGESIDLRFPIPSRCFDSDCEFKITVDADDDVTESDEDNNEAVGRCIG